MKMFDTIAAIATPVGVGGIAIIRLSGEAAIDCAEKIVFPKNKRLLAELESHKLNNLCDALNISFSHHDAYDDAYACAMALLRIMYDYSLVNLSELSECFDIGVGHIYPGCSVHTAQKKKSKKKKKKKILSV